MSDFLAALGNPDLPFLRYALIAGLASSLAFGVTGTLVTTRRVGSMAGAVAHSALGGVGAAFFLQYRLALNWLSPLAGALAAALISAFFVALIHYFAKQRADSLLNTVWALGMATGLILIKKTPGYIDASSYLFGSILMTSASDLILVLILDSLVLLIGAGLLRYHQAVAFDPVFCRVRGTPVFFYDFLLYLMCALAVVVMMNVMGVVMVIALLTLPSATAELFVHSLIAIIWLSVLLVAFLVFVGFLLSFNLGLPVGPVIAFCAGALYLGALMVRKKQ